MTEKSLPAPITTLTPPPWSGDTTLARVMAALNDDAGAPLTLLVGGCVRGAVMGRPVTDYDLATILTPDDVTARAKAAKMRVVPTGIDHGTVTVVADGRGFEVTRLRHDIETDGRHAVVGFTGEWRVDAARRDFTLNTLYADLAGHVYELIPSALDDARAGRVRFVGDARARVTEDYLRILRFFRFHACYGQGEIDADGLVACQGAAEQLRTLSRERVTAEIKKWFAADDPVPTVQKAIDTKVLGTIFDVEFDVMNLTRLIAIQRAVGWPDVLTRLLVLLGFNVDVIQHALRLSNSEINYLHEITDVKLESIHDASAIKRDMARYRQPPVLARLLIDLACTDDGSSTNFGTLRDFAVPVCPVSGNDLIALGVQLGPELGARLGQIKAAWIASDFQLDKATLIGTISKSL